MIVSSICDLDFLVYKIEVLLKQVHLSHEDVWTLKKSDMAKKK